MPCKFRLKYNFKDRSDKSKEKFADSLMSLGNTLHGAVLSLMLIAPVAWLGNKILSDGKSPLTDITYINSILDALLWPMILLSFGAGLFGIMAKNCAMDIYDELSKKNFF